MKYEVMLAGELKGGEIVVIGTLKIKILDFVQCMGAGLFGWGEYGIIDCKIFNLENNLLGHKVEKFQVYKNQPIIRVTE